jgi:hypothetical protein
MRFLLVEVLAERVVIGIAVDIWVSEKRWGGKKKRRYGAVFVGRIG